MSIQTPTKESQEAMQAKTQAVPPMSVGSLPEGGTVGQVLTKTATGAEWDDVPEELPEGGTAGQVLKKTADGTAWGNIPEELPDYSEENPGKVLTVVEGEGGDENELEWKAVLPSYAGETPGKVLTVVEGATSEDPNEVSWETPVNPLPEGGTAGQVLTKTASGSEWANAAGGEEPAIGPSGKGTFTISGTPHPDKLGSKNTAGTNDYLEMYSSSYTLGKAHKQGTVSKVMLATDSGSGYNYGSSVIYRTTLNLSEQNAGKFFPAATALCISSLTARYLGIFRKNNSPVGELHGNIDVELIGGLTYQITLRDPFILWLTDVTAGSISLESFNSKAKIDLETGPFVMFDSAGAVDASSNTTDLGTWSANSSNIAKYFKIME